MRSFPGLKLTELNANRRWCWEWFKIMISSTGDLAGIEGKGGRDRTAAAGAGRRE
jgi:hypothetical protein